MTYLLLIRHAQSNNNAQPEHLRIPDPGLTDLGQQQALRAAQWLDQRSITHMYASPFLRALLTAEPIAKQLKLPVTIRADIFEQGGCYRGHLPGQEIGQPGMSREEIRVRFPAWLIDEKIGASGWWSSRPYETHEQARQRAKLVATWLTQEISSQPGCHAIVTHGDFKQLLVGELLSDQRGIRQWGPIHNTSISKFVFKNGRWTLDWYNSAHHLSPDLITL